jgi:hypothetical protein
VAGPVFRPGPIGLGIFLAFLSTFIWLLAEADEIKKCTKCEEMKREGKKNE